MSQPFNQSVYQEKTRGANIRVKRLKVHDSSGILVNQSQQYEQDPNNRESIDCDSAKCPNCRDTHKSIKVFSGKLGKIEQLVNSLQKKTERYHKAKEGTFLTTQFHINDQPEESNVKKNWLPSQALSKCSIDDLNQLVLLAGNNGARVRPRPILSQQQADPKTLKYKPSFLQTVVSQSPKLNPRFPTIELRQPGSYPSPVKSALAKPYIVPSQNPKIPANLLINHPTLGDTVPIQNPKIPANRLINHPTLGGTIPLEPQAPTSSAGSPNQIYQQPLLGNTPMVETFVKHIS